MIKEPSFNRTPLQQEALRWLRLSQKEKPPAPPPDPSFPYVWQLLAWSLSNEGLNFDETEGRLQGAWDELQARLSPQQQMSIFVQNKEDEDNLLDDLKSAATVFEAITEIQRQVGLRLLD